MQPRSLAREPAPSAAPPTAGGFGSEATETPEEAPAAPPEPAPTGRGFDSESTEPPAGEAAREIEPGAPAAPSATAPPAPSAPSAPPAAEAQGDWDVVPVFYGTDRARAVDSKRLDYGPVRGRRLELGRALVTVPKAHVIPTIERPWAIRIPYLDVTLYEQAEDPNKHFTMKELKTLSQEEFLALVRARLAASVAYKDHAFIFVHGYNTTFDFAIYRAAQIAYDLKFDGAPFAYSWPSGGGLSRYNYDRESSGQAQPYLKDFFKLVIEQTGAKSVSVIAHSMGNQPTLEVLKELKAAKPEGVIISQLILAAPDVDRDNFDNVAREIQGLAKGITLYAAANDRALYASRNYYGGVPRAGDVPAEGPLIVPGIDTIDVTAASTDSLSLNHSGYAENNALLSDIGLLILSGVRPPEKRFPSLEPVMSGNGEYWRFRAVP
jgi:esterase/lipase superfamily enzyme